MEAFAAPAIVVLGILLILGVVSRQRAGNLLFWIILICIAGPIVYGIAKTRFLHFASGDHPWWVYIVAFFIVLIILRLILNFIFPWRRR